MKTTSLSQVLEKAAKDGSIRIVEELGLNSDFISLNEAYRMHGREIVKRWIKEDLLQIVYSGPQKKAKMLNKKRLETVASSNNRTTYLPVGERY